MSVVGFDFGSQSCYIAVARQGGIETVANEVSERQTPSYVSFAGKQRFAGSAGKQQAVMNYKNTLFGFKKLIGRGINDDIVKSESIFLPFAIEDSDGMASYKVQYLNEQRRFSPEQLCAMILVKLKSIAEINLQKKVSDCVISVPQYFTDCERRRLIVASQIAGLNCLTLLNDTTAAALAYGIYKQDLPGEKEKSRNVVFVDMGHSSLQVSIASFNKGRLQVKASASIPGLGGFEFDKVLFKHFAEKFKKQYNIDCFGTGRSKLRLLNECERLKKLMSANKTPVPLNIECFVDDIDVRGTINRADFEELSIHLIQRIYEPMEAVLRDSKISKADLHAVEVVGGATRMPLFNKVINDVFGLTMSTTLNQDEVIARGCALQCATLSPTFRVREFSVKDVVPQAVSLHWPTPDKQDGKEIFPKNSEFPTSVMLTFFKREPFKIIASYTNPSELFYPNNVIGSFDVSKVVPQLDGESSKVKVKARYNASGCVSVESATLVEKIPDEPVLEDQEMLEDPSQSEVAAKASESGETTEKKQSDVNETKNETTEGAGTDEVDKEKTPQSAAKSPKKKEVKKNRVKYIDLPVKASVTLAVNEKVLNNYIEEELHMQSNDKLETQRQEVKNQLEEYVYNMRDKINGEYANFISSSVHEAFSNDLNAVENWLYEDGDDCNKQQYIDKLDSLKIVGDVTLHYYNEHQGRATAFSELGRCIQRYSKFVEKFNSGSEEYSHIEPEKVVTVGKKVEDVLNFLNVNMNSSNASPLHEPPVVLVADINAQRISLDSIAKPIVQTAKPKPPEPPKEEKKDDVKANVDDDLKHANGNGGADINPADSADKCSPKNVGQNTNSMEVD